MMRLLQQVLGKPCCCLIVSLCLLVLHGGPAQAGEAYEQMVSRQPNAVQLVIRALKLCVTQSLTEPEYKHLERKAIEAVKHIEAHCKQKNEKAAYQTARYYASEPEAATIIACASHLKPIINAPSLAKIMAPYKDDMNLVLAGGVPQPICR